MRIILSLLALLALQLQPAWAAEPIK